MIRLIPFSQGSKTWTWKLAQWMQAEPLEDQKSDEKRSEDNDKLESECDTVEHLIRDIPQEAIKCNVPGLRLFDICQRVMRGRL